LILRLPRRASITFFGFFGCCGKAHLSDRSQPPDRP